MAPNEVREYTEYIKIILTKGILIYQIKNSLNNKRCDIWNMKPFSGRKNIPEKSENKH